MIGNADAEMLRSQAPAAKQTQPECDTQDKEQFPDLSAGGDTVETPPEQKWQTVQSKADVKREQAKALSLLVVRMTQTRCAPTST